MPRNGPMNLLANENFPLDVVRVLKERGHDVIWIRTDCPGVEDEKIFKRARDEKRIIVTFDKDFGELAFHAKLPPPCGVILFRIYMPSPNYVLQLVITALESRTDWVGHFAVVTESQIRLKPLL